MNNKVLYLHGLESPQGGEKVDFLSTKALVHAPEMDYTRSDIFPFLVKTIEEFQPNIIIGSSMGGYAAYILGALYKIPVIAYNPALHSRSFDPKFPKFVCNHVPDELTVIIGEKDSVVNSDRTLGFLKDQIKDITVNYKIERIKNMGHRVPLDVFIDMYNKIN